MKRLLVVMAACATVAASTFAAHVRAQTAPAAPATFEVASIKPNKTGDGRVGVGMAPGGRFTATNIPAQFLIRQAFNIQDFQIVEAPDWIRSDRFDVVAKAPEGDGNITGEQMRPMLRALLEERFKLMSHTETREMGIYALVKARADGRLGPGLTPAATDCAAARGRRGGGPPPPLPQPGQKIDCGLMIGPGKLNAGGTPMSELARSLSQQVGRVIVDKTGLTGGFDVELTYTPVQLGAGGPLGAPNGAPVTADANAPNLFTALQEQLGLKLDSERGPVDVLVIDHIEQPAAD